MHDSRRIEQAAAEWLVRRDAGDWGEREQQALDHWLARSTRHRVAFLRLQAAWQETGRLQVLAAGTRSADAAAHLRGTPDLRATRFAPRRAPSRRRWRRGTAAMLALAVAGSALWAGWHLGGRSHAQFASSVGQVETVTLADGSVATLSSDSRLDVRMTRSLRHVELQQGEAFFEVAHDAGRPFEVMAGGRRVVAVGTRFSVRSDTESLRVVVAEGKVRLESPPTGDGRAAPVALLPAGSIATAGRNGVLVRSLPLDQIERYLEWRSGFLAFEDTTLAAAAAEFNRFSERKLVLADARVGELRIGGNFRWDNLDGFVHLLELGFAVRAEREPDRIVLHAK